MSAAVKEAMALEVSDEEELLIGEISDRLSLIFGRDRADGKLRGISGNQFGGGNQVMQREDLGGEVIKTFGFVMYRGEDGRHNRDAKALAIGTVRIYIICQQLS